MLFPELSAPTAAVTTRQPPDAQAGGLTMPRRRTTRANDRTNRIHAERQLNQAKFTASVVRDAAQSDVESGADPPPF